MAKLFIVATPIGNLEDITLRALRVLKEADLILAENTNKARILLNKYGIKNNPIKYEQHSLPKLLNTIISALQSDKNIALISEAGTPGISDPGNELIEAVLEKAEIIPIPGPSSVSAAASVAGIPMQKFLFLGFVPKKSQNKFFNELLESKNPVIFFETTYRIIKTIEKLKEICSDCHLIVLRELTKQFETIYRGKPEEIIKQLKETSVKGEFVIVFKKEYGK